MIVKYIRIDEVAELPRSMAELVRSLTAGQSITVDTMNAKDAFKRACQRSRVPYKTRVLETGGYRCLRVA